MRGEGELVEGESELYRAGWLSIHGGRYGNKTGDVIPHIAYSEHHVIGVGQFVLDSRRWADAMPFSVVVCCSLCRFWGERRRVFPRPLLRFWRFVSLAISGV